MAKEKVVLSRKSTASIRAKIKFFYTEKYFNKWMSKYIFQGLNYQQVHYFMRKMWSEGSVAVSSIKSADKTLAGLMADGAIDMGTNSIIITPWAPANRFNIYDFPTHIRLINTRGVDFITQKELELDKEAVIIYAQKNHKSIFSSIEFKINEIVDIEMKMRVSRKAQNQPWMFTFSPEDKENVKILMEQMANDEPYLMSSLNNPDKCKGITSGAPYITDKQEQDRQKVDNDILTMLGVNNVGIGEKKEHLIVDEVNANNEEIEEQGLAIKTEIEDGWDRANSCFNCNVVLTDLNEEYTGEYQKEEEQENEPIQKD